MPRASRSRCGVTIRRSSTSSRRSAVISSQLVRRRPVEDRGVEPFDPVVEPLEDGEEGVGQPVQHSVDDELLGARRLRGQPLADFLQRRAALAMGGDDVAAAEEGVDLDHLHLAPLGLLRPVVDEEHVLAEVVQLRPLAALQRVLQRQRVEPEDVFEFGDLLLARVGEVEPEVLVALQQLGDRVAVDPVEDAHGATLDRHPDAPDPATVRALGRTFVRQSRV